MIFLRGAAALVVCSAAVALGGGCSVAGSAKASCEPAPSKAVTAIKQAARSDFIMGASRISRLEVQKTSSVALPSSAKAHGVDHAMAALVNSVFPDGGGVETTELFAVGDGGSLVYPLDDHAARMFSVTAPSSSDWTQWAHKTYKSDQANQAYDCVTPS